MQIFFIFFYFFELFARQNRMRKTAGCRLVLFFGIFRRFESVLIGGWYIYMSEEFLLIYVAFFNVCV